MHQQQWIAGFYRTQLESTQDLMTASLEGFERIQQLATQAVRQQFDDQLRMVNAMTTRSAEALADPEFARPALERMIDVQRQFADAVVRTNQRVFSAVSSSAQRAAEHAVPVAGNGSQGEDAEGYTAAFNSALQQWQELANRMLDVFQEQFAAVTDQAQQQGQRAFGQVTNASGRAMQAGLPAQASGEQTGERKQGGSQEPGQQGRAGKNERKHEMA